MVYPASWYILVGPTGLKKSSCTRIGIKLLRKAVPTHIIIEEKATPEGLIEALSRHEIIDMGGRRRDVQQADAICTIHAPELGVFLGRQMYNEGLVILLTSLIDSPDHFDSVLVKKDRTLKNVAITGLAASNPDWLAGAVSIDVHGGGFLSRVIFVSEQSTERCFPRPPKLDTKVRQQLIEQLQAFTELQGEWVLSPGADKWFDNWYRTEGKRISEIEGMENRRPDHVLRLGMLLSVSEGEKNVLLQEHLEQALGILDHIIGKSEIEIQEFTLRNEAYYTVRKILRKYSPVKHSDLIRRCSVRGIRATEVKEYLSTLLEGEEIKESKADRRETGRGKLAKIYTWKGGVV